MCFCWPTTPVATKLRTRLLASARQSRCTLQPEDGYQTLNPELTVSTPSLTSAATAVQPAMGPVHFSEGGTGGPARWQGGASSPLLPLLLLLSTSASLPLPSGEARPAGGAA